MSFILDALKKSESDRQRQSGPALFEVKLAPPRTGLPPWGLAVGALLLVNLGVVMWMLLRHAATPAPGTPPVAAAGARAPPLPQLRLDLHVFAARTQDRFVMINMHKLREGDSLPEGVQVESITPEGAVLSYNGSKFLLPR